MDNIEFFQLAVEIPYKKTVTGKPHFEDRDYIRFYIPGGREVFDCEVTEEHKIQYPRHWAQYQAKRAQVGDGIPLEQWPAISKAEIANLKINQIHTVEQLADVSDLHCSNLGMGFQTLKRKAIAYLAAAKDNAPIEKLTAENASLKDELAAVKEQLADLMTRLPKKGDK